MVLRSSKLHIHTLAIFVLLSMGVARSVFAADFFSVTPELTAPHDALALYRIFTTGVGSYDSSMNGKLYPYPLRKNGDPDGDLFNGCYDDLNNKIGPLDSDNSCASTIASNPGKSIFRLFTGYKVDCADTTGFPGTCQDMALLINCQLSQVHVPSGAVSSFVPLRQCSTGNPIVRRAKANPNYTPVGTGCYLGQDGTDPGCKPCEKGYYNDANGTNTQACIKCPLPVIQGVDIEPILMTTNPESGAVSASQCMIDPTDPWTCAEGYTKSPDKQQCVQGTGSADACKLSLSLIPTHPSAPGMNDGKIIATYANASGAVSNFSIIAPSSIASVAMSGSSATFDLLAHNTYTVSVTDSICTETASISLTAPTSVSCSTCPTGSSASGNLCVILGQTSCPTGFTLDGMGTCTLPCTTGTALGVCNLDFIVTTINQVPKTPTGTGGASYETTGSSGFVSFGISPMITGMSLVDHGTSGNAQNIPIGTYFLTATDENIPGCKKSLPYTVFYKPPISVQSPKGTAKFCHKSDPVNAFGNKFSVTCFYNSAGKIDAYSNFSPEVDAEKEYITCTGEDCSGLVCDPMDICNKDSLFDLITPPMQPEQLKDCSTITCSSGSLILFSSAPGLGGFVSSNVYTNPTPKNSCKTGSSPNLLGFCSSATPATPTSYEACPLSSGQFYYRTQTDPACT